MRANDYYQMPAGNLKEMLSVVPRRAWPKLPAWAMPSGGASGGQAVCRVCACCRRIYLKRIYRIFWEAVVMLVFID